MASDKEAELFVIKTTGNIRKLEIKWIFQNATMEWPDKGVGVKMSSPFSHASGDEEVKWCIEIFPNGNKDPMEILMKTKDGFLYIYAFGKLLQADPLLLQTIISLSMMKRRKSY